MLELEAPVVEIVPELEKTSFRGATVRQLLDMRTGTRFDEDYRNPEADVRRCEAVYLWRPPPPGRRGRAPTSALEYFVTLRNDGPHGGAFRYRSILADVLAWVIERSAGARFHEVVSRELWQPMGAELDAVVTLDGHGNPMADGGICANLRDLARFGLLFLNGGRSGGGQVLPEAFVDDTIRGAPDGPDAFSSGEGPASSPPGAHYRNCWWVRDAKAAFLYAWGIYGQHVFVHRPTATVVVKLSTCPDPSDRRLVDATAAAAVTIGEHLEGGSD